MRMSRWGKTSIQLYIARSVMRVNGETLVIRGEMRQYVPLAASRERRHLGRSTAEMGAPFTI
jgi:hypothetical protein